VLVKLYTFNGLRHVLDEMSDKDFPNAFLYSLACSLLDVEAYMRSEDDRNPSNSSDLCEYHEHGSGTTACYKKRFNRPA
jgi:hypothetical protein